MQLCTYLASCLRAVRRKTRRFSHREVGCQYLIDNKVLEKEPAAVLTKREVFEKSIQNTIIEKIEPGMPDQPSGLIDGIRGDRVHNQSVFKYLEEARAGLLADPCLAKSIHSPDFEAATGRHRYLHVQIYT